MRQSRIACAFLMATSIAAWCRAGELNLYVNVPSFVVAVAPVDEESREAESSILYVRPPDGEWMEDGPCGRKVLEDGGVRFTREVRVETDGVYLFTSRPVVGGAVENEPGASSRAQATVIVDTLPPMAELLSPSEEALAEPGAVVVIEWRTEDENLAPTPAALSYTTDGGKSWHAIAGDLPAEGYLDWHIPDDLDVPIIIRLAATDLAGNIGRAMRGVDLAVRDAPVPVAPPADAPPPVAPPMVADAAGEPAPKLETDDGRDNRNRSWLYYLMAVNLMRQNKPADALQYYWLSVKEDPEFIDAWADIALAYLELGAFRSAEDVLRQTRSKAPDRLDIMHLSGEACQAEGLALLRSGKTEDRVRARKLIDQAVDWYGKALEQAAKTWRLAEQAPSFYRLGEICYFVNLDADGARAYWSKILELHTPTPNSDLVLWTAEHERGKAKSRYQKQTVQKVSLTTWQNWARGYLVQLDERERQTIMDLTPAERVIAAPPSLSYGDNAIAPGRDDGRSLFSLPDLFGMPVEPKPVPEYQTVDPLDGYSLYGGNDQRKDKGGRRQNRRAGRASIPAGAVPPQQPGAADPYVFPSANPTAEWLAPGPFGNRPE